MAHCEDCGTRISDGMCPYCDEELFILVTQGEDTDCPLSEEFMTKVDEQTECVKKRNSQSGDARKGVAG